MRSGAAKMLFYVSIGSMMMLAYYAVVNYQRQEIPQDQSTKIKMLENKILRLEQTLQNQSLTTTTSNNTEVTTKASEMKYILQWTSGRSVPFVYMGEGQSGYFQRKCKYSNCYVTSVKSYLPDIRKFDVIAFNGPEVVRYGKDWLPKKRSPHQKYAFASIESSDYYPVCNDLFNGFFNWTWTFKTSSDSRWGYLIIRDANKKVIGPNTIMHWMKLEDMDPVSKELKQKLRKKTKAAAWFVSNCNSRSGREHYVRQLQEELRKYKLNVDIYGTCGTLECSRDKHDDECVKLIDRDYYFYLSFENSFSEDYVTEKLLHAVQHNAVPIVYGGANYTSFHCPASETRTFTDSLDSCKTSFLSLDDVIAIYTPRFMPDGIYLNARKLGVQKLAMKMHELINDPEEYSQYFRWQNHYSYHYRDIVPETNDYCHFCEMLNDEKLVKKTTIYENFREWWTPPNRC